MHVHWCHSVGRGSLLPMPQVASVLLPGICLTSGTFTVQFTDAALCFLQGCLGSVQSLFWGDVQWRASWKSGQWCQFQRQHTPRGTVVVTDSLFLLLNCNPVTHSRIFFFLHTLGFFAWSFYFIFFTLSTSWVRVIKLGNNNYSVTSYLFVPLQ